ncbi:M24 family metallopeptidase [Planctomycetota bacterium]
MNSDVIKRRVKAIQADLKKKKIDCLIITNQANVTYTTGFMGDDSWAVINKARVYLLTDSRYTEQAQNECPSCRIMERKKLMSEALGELTGRFKSVRTAAVESSIPVAGFTRLKKALKARLITKDNIIENIRKIKDKSEIKLIETAASIAAKALEQSRRYIKPGITECELAGRIDFEIKKLGASNSFETIVAFGPNASRAHHQPGARKIKKKDTVLIDFGARYRGYCSDITRCFAVGRASDFYRKVYDAVERAQAEAIQMVKAGIKIKELDAVAKEIIAKSNLPVYGHGTGHGLGIEVHELPALNSQYKGVLEAGCVVTIEPGVYIPGKLGIRMEDDVLVTENGCKILTKRCPHLPL